MSAPPPSTSVLAVAVALGGALGAVLRWAVELAAPHGADGFPWATFGINVVGSAVLAALPLVPAARRTVPAAFLGPGVLGGFTTMSAASVETIALVDAGHLGLAGAYCLGTLAAALLAVALVPRRVVP